MTRTLFLTDDSAGPEWVFAVLPYTLRYPALTPNQHAYRAWCWP